MKKSVSTQELENRIGEIVDSVHLQGDRYIIERDGKPVAAVVPVEVMEIDEQERTRFFDLIEKIHERNKVIPEKEIEDAINQVIAEVREEKRWERATT